MSTAPKHRRPVQADYPSFQTYLHMAETHEQIGASYGKHRADIFDISDSSDTTRGQQVSGNSDS